MHQNAELMRHKCFSGNIMVPYHIIYAVVPPVDVGSGIPTPRPGDPAQDGPHPCSHQHDLRHLRAQVPILLRLVCQWLQGRVPHVLESPVRSTGISDPLGRHLLKAPATTRGEASLLSLLFLGN